MDASRAALSEKFLQAERSAPNPAALVLGTGITGFAVARALRRSGVVVLGVDAHPHYPSSYSSKWTDVCFVGDVFDDARLIDWLVEQGARCTRRPVLFVTTDEQVKLVACDNGRLSSTFFVEKSTEASTGLLMNKERFHERARSEGWPVPQSWSIASRAELDAIADSLTYPVILKPRVKNRAFRTSAPAKAFRCGSAIELMAGYDAFARAEPEAIVQAWVPGGDAAIRYSFHYFTSGGRELCHFEGRKIRQWVPYCGSSSSSTRCDDERVAPRSAEILRSCGAVGLCSVEYKEDPRTGAFVIMEPTIGRPNLQLGAALANGVDLVTMGYQHLAGLPLSPVRPTARRATWLIVPSDLRSAAHYRGRGELTWAGWLRSLSFPLVPAVWTPFDAGLWRAFLAKGFRAVGRRIRRAIS